MSMKKREDKQIESVEKIDFSDIPEMTDEQLAQLQPSHLRNPENYRPIKKKISIYVDADVLDHYKSKGKGYQTKINRVLRQGMLRETAPSYGKEDTSSKSGKDF
ncbi:BrnA antitoxin family protein [uncultured Sphaerochaeta sp.]|uniref:BrnA antitoxin family protein n=1 Tax=uncultured Sphaerochaeta sp. TaxID=886478 RepID=UPI0029CA16B0|nr:BrnA antitoxin family protein [uncultured Sphaerochaeta sp.]